MMLTNLTRGSLTILLGLLITIHSCLALTKNEAIEFFRLNPQHEITFLTIKGYQQTEDYTCGPAAVMSLMHYYGLLTDQELNKTTELKIAKEMGTSEETGTSPQQIVQWLNNHGFIAKTGKDGSVAMLRENLAKGIPTLIDWIDWGGHWVAMAGYEATGKSGDITKDTLFFADPAAHDDNIITKDGITFFNAERFSYMWFDSEHTKNIYITAVPKQPKTS